MVHCQGRAVWSKGAAPVRLDVEQLQRQAGEEKQQALARLRLGEGEEGGGWSEYVLHPSLLGSALQACAGLVEDTSGGSIQAGLPLALDSLRIISSCSREMLAWVRYAAGSGAGAESVKLDVDLCDERGNVCVQMRGVSWQRVSLSESETIININIGTGAAVVPAVAAAPIQVMPPARARKEISFLSCNPASPAGNERRKPAAISLAAPGALALPVTASSAGQPAGQSSAARSFITLATAATGVATAAASAVRLFDCGQGSFSMQIAVPENSHTTGQMMSELRQALDRVQQEALLKVVTISGLERCFAGGGRDSYNEAVEQKLYEALVAFPYPVIAAVEGDAVGGGLLAAVLCDFVVCSEEGSYGYSDAENGFYARAAERKLLRERLSGVQAEELLYLGSRCKGGELRERGWTCAIVAGGQVESRAEQLAAMLVDKSQLALRVLKQHLTRHLVGLVRELRRVEAADPATLAVEDRDGQQSGCAWVAQEIPSPAEHIRLESPADNVMVVRLCAGGSQVGARELIGELRQAFAWIRQRGGCRAMVLASEDEEFVPGA